MPTPISTWGHMYYTLSDSIVVSDSLDCQKDSTESVDVSVVYDKKTKIKDIIEMIKGEINANGRAIEVEFTAPIFSEIVYKNHFLHEKPSKFKWAKSAHVGGDLSAFFPGIGWRHQSYKKVCKKTPYTKEEYILESINSKLREFFGEEYACIAGEKCSCGKFAEVQHHQEPSFDTIYKACVKLIPPQEISDCDYRSNTYLDKWIYPCSPVMNMFHSMHKNSVLVPMCKECHYKAHGKNRS